MHLTLSALTFLPLLITPALSATLLTFGDRECTWAISAIDVSRETGCSNIPGGDQVWAIGGLRDGSIPAGCAVGFFSDESCNTNAVLLDETAQPATCWPANTMGIRTFRVTC